MFDQWPARGPTSIKAWNTPEPIHSYGPGKTVRMKAHVGDEREARFLKELLAAFPGFSLEDIANAFTEADSDVNAAADLLATRQPSVRSNGTQEGRKNSRKTDGNRRQSAELPVVKPDDLLLEKYGRGVGELINQRQSNSLLHNVQSAHDGACHNASHLNSRTAHGLRGDNRSSREEVVNKEDSYGVSGDGALLVGWKETKQKGRGCLDNEVEVVDAKRQADEEFLLSMLGNDSELGMGVVRDVLDNYKGDTQKSLEVILQMVSSTSPQAKNVDSTIKPDECYFDDKKLHDRRHLDYQRMESHVDKAPMQTSMQHQKYHEGFWNGRNLVPKAEIIANGYSHQRSIEDRTDHDHHKPVLFDGHCKQLIRTSQLSIGQWVLQDSMKQLKECFPQVHDSYLFRVLQSNNFVLCNAVQDLLDGTADKHVTSCSVESNLGLGNRSNTLKSNVLEENDSLVTARSPPWKAARADVKRTITPLKQNLTDVKRGVTDKASEGKNGSCGGIDDYRRVRRGAHEHWRMMDYYFKEAAAAYDRGERCRAADLAETGKEYKQLAQEADGRASQRLFQSRNKGIVNNITIDLHAQHVNEAINVLKRHLQTLCSITSVHMLTVITGYGSHSMNGSAKIKPAVTDFLSRSGIPWEEVNEGCLTIKMVDVSNKQLDISDGEESKYRRLFWPAVPRL